MSNVPKWLLVLIIGSVSVCLCCGGVAVFAGYKGRQAAPKAVAKEVALMVEGSLANNRVTNGMLVISESDLDVNNAIAFGGSSEIYVGNDGTQISGFTTTISPDSIVIASSDGSSVLYEAKAAVRNGRVDMQVESGGNRLFNILNFKRGLFDGLERGINNTLAARGLQATSVTLHDGSLTIETVPL